MSVHYITIGNGDDRLSQRRWASFMYDVGTLLAGQAERVHGEWVSAADAPWQNACWCIEDPTPDTITTIRDRLAELADEYGQDSIAWVTGDTEFITGTDRGGAT